MRNETAHSEFRIPNSELNMRLLFTKMVGTGNDFIVVDRRAGRAHVLRHDWRAISRALCDRHRGIGADGLLVLEPSSAARARMRVFNPDGSEAQMCGNGARCVALYEATSNKQQATAANRVTIETKAGVLSATVRGERVALRMTDPTGLQLHGVVRVGAKQLRFGFVNTGVPHVVVPVATLDDIDVSRLGRTLRYHRRFSPKGTNVNFIQADARHRLRIRTYERGVEGETLACGTGVTASAIIHALSASNGRATATSHRVEVKTRSGDRLTVSFTVASKGDTLRMSDVVLEGPARRVFDGAVEWPLERAR